MSTKLTFLGATKSVTGSRFLLETEGSRFLIDCGLHQERDLQDRNWRPFPVPPREIDAVLLTHAHIDHSGLIPKFTREGFHNRVYCTPATADITRVMLLDSARLQEQDAEHKRKRHERDGLRGTHPELPLYTERDAEACLPLFSPVPYRQTVNIGKGVEFTLYDAGHVLGSGMIEVRLRRGRGEMVFLFTGDMGRWSRPILHDPTLFERADYVVTESTYADQTHPDPEALLQQFTEVIRTTLQRGGNVVIPSFALERAQDMLYYLNLAWTSGQLPPVPVYLDSPMAVSITGIFERHAHLFDEDMRRLMRAGKSPFDYPGLRMVSSSDESRAIERAPEPSVIIAGSGMCTGGRIKYHLVNNITRPESTVLFVGYQAAGTLGRQIADGVAEARILGQFYPVKARVVQMHGFSSHADGAQLRRWLYNLKEAPRNIFVVHGEEHAAEYLAVAVRQEKGWNATVPEYMQEFTLE